LTVRRSATKLVFEPLNHEPASVSTARRARRAGVSRGGLVAKEEPMTTPARITFVALTALAVGAARADQPAQAEKCSNQGAPGVAWTDAAKPCAENLTQDGRLRDETAEAQGSATAEPTYAENDPGAGYDGSGNVDPGYYVSDPSESQFLLDIWTKGGG
jgi:hypothetical protein